MNPKNEADIAILKLRHPLKFDSDIQPISLPTTFDPSNPNSCYASGWGDTKYGGNISNDLLFIQRPALTGGQCGGWTGYQPEHDPNTMVCAGSVNGKSTCQGK